MIGQAQPEPPPTKRQETGPDAALLEWLTACVKFSFIRQPCQWVTYTSQQILAVYGLNASIHINKPDCFVEFGQTLELDIYKGQGTCIQVGAFDDKIGILCGYAIRSGRHPEGSQRPPDRPQVGPGRWLPEYRVTTKYSFYPVRTHKMLNNCANCALKWEIPWFDGELFIHTCMTSSSELTSPVKWSPRAEGPSLCSPKDCAWPIKSQNTNMDLFNT